MLRQAQEIVNLNMSFGVRVQVVLIYGFGYPNRPQSPKIRGIWTLIGCCQNAEDIDLAAALGVDQHLGVDTDTNLNLGVNSESVGCVLAYGTRSQLVN